MLPPEHADEQLSGRVFEVWDAELGVLLGAFDDEVAALERVRALCVQSDGSRAPLGLVHARREVIATGDALVERAFTQTQKVTRGSMT